MKNSERIYQDMKTFWETYNTHPFVQGMADGSLSKDQFKFYITQDHLYLMEYAKIFAMGVIKAPCEADQRLFAGLITATLDVENAIHKTYLARLGLTNEDLAAAQPSLTTESYTHYMLAIAQKEGMASIMAALLACSWTYKLIGDYLETYPGAKEQEFYGLWINQYMGEEYRSANDLMIDMFDRFSEGCSEEEYQHLKHIIYQCSRYEYMFWDMGFHQTM